MTRSMTAFARAQAGQVSWEIRSVNQRYLDPTFKIPDNIRMIEPNLRNYLKSQLDRGKIDCVLRIDAAGSSANEAVINQAEVESLLGLIRQVEAASPDLAPVNPLELLKWPGVLRDDSADFEALLTSVEDVFKQAVDSLVVMREREGADLERVVMERLDSVTTIVADVRKDKEAILKSQQQKLRDRIAELEVDLDTGRLEQELVYLAQKSDVAEELDRLDTHTEEVRNTLKRKGAIGRRLDFLMQELNREANTLSAKSIAAEVSIQAVELKVIIEQMREQIQNIE